MGMRGGPRLHARPPRTHPAGGSIGRDREGNTCAGMPPVGRRAQARGRRGRDRFMAAILIGPRPGRGPARSQAGARRCGSDAAPPPGTTGRPAGVGPRIPGQQKKPPGPRLDPKASSPAVRRSSCGLVSPAMCSQASGNLPAFKATPILENRRWPCQPHSVEFFRPYPLRPRPWPDPGGPACRAAISSAR
jgi:hypothetical protein